MPTFEVETDTDIFDVEAATAEEARAIVEAQLGRTGPAMGAPPPQSQELGDTFQQFLSGSPTEAIKNRAAESATVEAAPLFGPWVSALSTAGHAAYETATGDDSFQRNVMREQTLNKVAQNEAPGWATVGNVAGAVAGGIPFSPGIGASAALGAGDAAVRGGDATEIIGGGVLGGVGAGVGNLLGRGLAKGGRAIRDYLSPFRPSGAEATAERVVGRALAADQQAGLGMSAAGLETAEGRMGNPIMNVDMGGKNTLDLAKTASEYGNDISHATRSRSQGQVDRIQGAWNKLANVDNLDNLDVRGKLEVKARTERAPLYDRAYNDPNAQEMWSDDLQQLTNRPDVKDAISSAIRESKNVSGQPVKHPFVEKADGTYELRSVAERRKIDAMREKIRKSNSMSPHDKERALFDLDKAEEKIIDVAPNLAFWDIVQRQLRLMGKSQKQSGSVLWSNSNSLRGQLNEILDTQVPAFNAARTHAAKLFGAEELYEAGEQAAMRGTKSSWSNLKRDFAKLTPSERKLFMAGHAKAEYNRLAGTNRDTDISGWYNNRDLDAKLNDMYGPALAGEFKIQMGIERAMEESNRAVGGSRNVLEKILGALGTSQSLALGGAATGAGYYAMGGDAKGAALIASGGASRYLFRKLSAKQREAVFKEVAKLLASDDPAVRAKLLERAKDSEAHLQTIKYIGDVMSQAGRAGAQAGRMTLDRNEQ